MNRRQVLAGAGLLAVASRASADDAKPMPAGHEHHAGMGPNAALIASAHHCMAAADVCLAHCIDRLADGDKTMADCARSVEQMRSLVTALAEVAAQKAPYLKELATLCAKACRDCQAQCKKHEQHAPCKACGDACEKCAAECDKA